MSKQQVFTCDYCGKRAAEYEAINWIETWLLGIDARSYGDGPIEGQFCSRECCASHLMGGQKPARTLIVSEDEQPEAIVPNKIAAN